MRIEHKLMTRTTCEILHKSKQWVAGGLALAFLVALGACLPARPNPETATGTAPAGGGEGAAAMGFELRSEVFVAGEFIPGKFTCDGSDVSPPLSWTGLPQGVASLALIMEDPDAAAGIWVHWLLYNIPASLDGLPEGVPADSELPDGSRSGLNSWGRSGYGGPCPPRGTHRYFFRLYALDAPLDLAPGATKEALQGAMQGHLLGQTEIMGTYARSQ